MPSRGQSATELDRKRKERNQKQAAESRNKNLNRRATLSEVRRLEDKTDAQIASGSPSQTNYARLMGYERDSGAPDTTTPAARAGARRAATARKAAARKAPAKKAAAKKAAAKKAAAKKAAAKRSPAKKAASKKGFLDRLGEGFKKATAKTGKPNKRMFQRGARMTPGEKRKYEAAMKRWEKKNK